MSGFTAEDAEFWSTYAENYQVMCRTILPYRRMQSDAARAVGSRITILDLGAGTGETTRAILEENPRAKVTGYDFAAAMVSTAQESLGGRATFVEHDITTAIPTRPGSADCVVSVNVLYTLPDPAQRILEWSTYLKPSGKIVLVTPKQQPSVGLILKSHKGCTKPDVYWESIYDSPERTQELVAEALIAEDASVFEKVLWVVEQNKKILSNTNFTFLSPQQLRDFAIAAGFHDITCTATFADQSTRLEATKGES